MQLPRQPILGRQECQRMALADTFTDAYGVKTTTQYDANDRAVETSVADCAALVYNYVNSNLGGIERAELVTLFHMYRNLEFKVLQGKFSRQEDPTRITASLLRMESEDK